MGTSQSSKGPGAGVPMVPPWVPDLPNAVEPVPDDGEPIPEPLQIPQPGPISDAGRFRDVRRALGNFAQTGKQSSMQRGLQSYVKKGYGGSRTATARMAATVATGVTLFGVLSDLASRGTENTVGKLDAASLAGKTAREVMDAILEAVRPIDGTLDAETTRMAICDAESELLTRYEDADFLNLSAEQREFFIESFLAKYIKVIL
jgi:hypothetical protein